MASLWFWPTANNDFLSSPADKVDNLQLVAFHQLDAGPAIAGNNIAVEFYGQPIGLHSQLIDEGCQSDRRLYRLGLAIDDELHQFNSRNRAFGRQGSDIITACLC